MEFFSPAMLAEVGGAAPIAAALVAPPASTRPVEQRRGNFTGHLQPQDVDHNRSAPACLLVLFSVTSPDPKTPSAPCSPGSRAA
jgi:hypothetical protein